MKALKSSIQDQVQHQSDHCDSTSKSKSIGIPTIFDDGEAYDSALSTPDYGSHKFWATEDATEASELDATLHHLTARLSKFYIPKHKGDQKPSEPSLQNSSESIVSSSRKRSRHSYTSRLATSLVSSSSLGKGSEKGAPKRKPSCHPAMNEGLKRTWSVFEDRDYDDDQHEPNHTTTPSRARLAKRARFVPALIDLQVSHAGNLQTSTLAASELLAGDRLVTGKAPAALVLADAALSTVSTPLKRKRSLLSDSSQSIRGQKNRIKA